MKIACAVMFASAAICSTAVAEEKVELAPRDVSVSGAPWVMVQTDAGSIQMRTGAEGVVRVEATATGPSKEALKPIAFTAQEQRGVVRIYWKKVPGVTVSFRVQAPAPCRLQLVAKGGAIDVDGFSGGVSAATVGGAIDARSLKGELSLRSQGGAVNASGVEGVLEIAAQGGAVNVSGQPRGSSSAQATGGSVTFRVPAQAKLSVTGLAQGGAAENDFGWPVANGHFAGKIGDGSGGSLNVRATGGSVSVKKM